MAKTAIFYYVVTFNGQKWTFLEAEGEKFFLPNLVEELLYQRAKSDFRVQRRVLIFRWSKIGKNSHFYYVGTFNGQKWTFPEAGG